MAIAVAGMHRSGTSMVAKLLHHAGVYLGREGELRGPAPDNADGFWENAKFAEINTELLSSLGGGWDSPPASPRRWDEGDEHTLQLHRSARLLVAEFEQYPAWGWKDPCNSLTLPFWQTLVDDLRVVVCVRNPLEVAFSLHRRNSLSYSLALTLWLEYNVRLLAAAPEEHRVVTHYDAYFEDPRREATRLVRAIGLPTDEDGIVHASRSPIPELRHARFRTRELIDAEVSSDVVDLYLALCREAEWVDGTAPRRPARPPAASPGDSGPAVRRLNEQALELTVLRRAHERHREHLAEREALVADLKARLDLLGRESHQLAEEVHARDETIRKLRAELDETAGHAGRTAEAVAGRDETIRRLQAQLEELGGYAKRTAEDVARRDDTVRALQGQLEELSRHARRTAEEIARRDETIRGLQGQLEELSGHARRSGDEIDRRDHTIHHLQAQFNELAAHARRTAEELDNRRDELALRRDELRELQAEVAKAARERTESSLRLEESIAGAQRGLQQRDEEISDLRHRLALAEEEIRAARAELVAAAQRAARGAGVRRLLAAVRSGIVAALPARATTKEPAPGGPPEATVGLPASARPPDDYVALRKGIQALARAALPGRPAVAVVSRGDDELLRMVSPRAVHFPRAEDGSYAGYHPADSGAAINHLEALRETGVEFLLFPATALWWLDHYEALRDHLEERYDLIKDAAVCRIYNVRRARPEPPPVAPGGNGVDIFCFPIIDWDFRFQRPQQLSRQFARTGHRVFYVATRFQQVRDDPIVEPIADGVYGVRLPGPDHVSLYADELSPAVTEQLVAALDRLRRIARIGDAISIVDLPFWAPLALEARERWGWRIVYDCMDDYGGFETTQASMLAWEDVLMRESDLLLATSGTLYERHAPRARRALLLPNAADFDHFSVERGIRPLGDLPRPTVGYYGAISDWFDADTIRRAALARREWTFVLIGDTFGGDVERLRALENVHLVGEQPYESLPPYLHQFDVACIPFQLTSLTQATNPVKFYEYLSAGKPVVATDLPELAPYGDYYYRYPAGDSKQFVRQVERALEEDSPEVAEARAELARRNTWEARYRTLSPLLRPYYQKAAIVVLSFDNLDYLKLCLESVWENTLYPNYEVIVVDNGSSQRVVNYLAKVADGERRLRLILNDENVGFARANNMGLEAASDAEYVFLLNDDTIVSRGWLGKLIRYLQDERIGLVGPVTNWAGNEARIDVPYADISGMPAFAERHMREHAGRSFDIAVLAMYCIGIRRGVLEKVGYLNERFGVGMFEDDDFAMRVRKAWYRVVCAEDVFVHHWGRASFSRLDQDVYDRLFEQNRQTFEEIWGRPWQPHRTR